MHFGGGQRRRDGAILRRSHTTLQRIATNQKVYLALSRPEVLAHFENGNVRGTNCLVRLLCPTRGVICRGDLVARDLVARDLFFRLLRRSTRNIPTSLRKRVQIAAHICLPIRFLNKLLGTLQEHLTVCSAVRTHISDVSSFIKFLTQPHRLLRGYPEFVAGRLLEAARRKWNRLFFGNIAWVAAPIRVVIIGG